MSNNRPIREGLVSSAVTFLQDPSVASSPIAKRLAFLETKGLTPAETEEAIQRSSSTNLGTPGSPLSANHHGPLYYDPRPIDNGRDWRDWFVMSVVGGGVGYLLIGLARKYLIPALQPPSATELEEAQARLEQKYDEASEILKIIQSDTEIVRNELATQRKKLDQSIKDVETAIEECMESEIERTEEVRKIKDEIQQLKSDIPQMFDQNKVAQTNVILDLQRELKSLKSLLTTRPSSSTVTVSQPSPPTALNSSHTFGIQPPTTSPSALRFAVNRPIGIPAWQLAATATNLKPDTPTTSGTTYTAGPSPPRESSTPASSAAPSPQLVQIPVDVNVSLPNPELKGMKPLVLGRNGTRIDNPDEDEDQIINNGFGTPEGTSNKHPTEENTADLMS